MEIMATVLTFLYIAQELVGKVYDQTHVELRRLRNVFALLLVLFVVTIVVGSFCSFQTKLWAIPLIVLPGSLVFLWTVVRGVPFVTVVGSIVLSARHPANNAIPPATVPTPVSNTNIIGDVFDAAVVYGRFIAAVLGSMLAVAFLMIFSPINNAPYLSMLVMMIGEAYLASAIWGRWENEKWRRATEYITIAVTILCLAIMIIPKPIRQGMIARWQEAFGDEKDQIATGVYIVDSFLNLVKGDSGLQQIVVLVFAVGSLLLLFRSKGIMDFIKNSAVLVVIFVAMQWFFKGGPLETADYAICLARERSLKVKIDCDTPGWEDRAKEVMEKRRLAASSASPVVSTTGAAVASTTPPAITSVPEAKTPGYVVHDCVIDHNEEIMVSITPIFQERLASGCKSVTFIERAATANLWFDEWPCPDKVKLALDGTKLPTPLWQNNKWYNTPLKEISSLDKAQRFALGRWGNQTAHVVMSCE